MKETFKDANNIDFVLPPEDEQGDLSVIYATFQADITQHYPVLNEICQQLKTERNDIYTDLLS